MKLIPHKNSIIIKYILVLIIVIIFPFSIFISIALNSIDNIEKQSAEQYLSTNLEVVSSTIDSILSNLENAHTNLVLDANFTRSIKKLKRYDEREAYPDYQHTKTIMEKIKQTAVNTNYIHSVYAYSYLANRIFTSKTNWDERFNHYDKDDSFWLNAYASSSLSNHPWYLSTSIEDGRSILSCYREIKELDVPLFGLVSINVDTGTLSSFLSKIKIDNTGYCFMIDSQGSFISGNTPMETNLFDTITTSLPTSAKAGFYTTYLNKEKFYICYKLSEYNNFTYVVAVPSNKIETITPLVSYLNFIYLIAFAIILILAVFIAYFYLYKPIKTLVSYMHKIQNGDFTIRLPENKNYEIGYLNSNFNNMVDDLDHLIQKNYVSELISKDAQLKSLQSKLNEHFLYNTLDTIRWKARSENAPKTCNLILQLAKFYRLSLSSGKEFVPVREVIDLINSYSAIQEERMGNALQHTIECDEGLLDYPVLKYLFQPIVENAVIHGMKNITHTESIRIFFKRKHDKFIFSVEDNGSGIEPTHLADILLCLSDENSSAENHFALKTLNTQLTRYYGNESHLHITSEYRKGCNVWFELPMQKLLEVSYVKNDYY